MACARMTYTGKHFKPSEIWIEDPPWMPHPNTGVSTAWVWTDDFQLANRPQPVGGHYYEYLPAVLLHELGHALGLDDTRIPNIIMGPDTLKLEQLTATDTAAAEAIYASHVKH